MFKNYLILLCFLAIPAFLNAESPSGSPIPFQYERIKPLKPGSHNPKSPVLAPTVYIDGYALTFDTPCDGCTLQLVDEDNDVVYSIVIPVGTTTLYLPSYLEGTFELQIICGEWLFYGEIEL